MEKSLIEEIKQELIKQKETLEKKKKRNNQKLSEIWRDPRVGPVSDNAGTVLHEMDEIDGKIWGIKKALEIVKKKSNKLSYRARIKK